MPTSPTLYSDINVHAGPSATHPCSSMVVQIISDGSSHSLKAIAIFHKAEKDARNTSTTLNQLHIALLRNCKSCDPSTCVPQPSSAPQRSSPSQRAPANANSSPPSHRSTSPPKPSATPRSSQTTCSKTSPTPRTSSRQTSPPQHPSSTRPSTAPTRASS